MADDILIVTEAELRSVLRLDDTTTDLVENAFAALASKNVIMPPVMSMDIPQMNAEVDVKTAYMPGAAGFAIKVSPGFFDNPKLGLSSLNGLMMLLSARTGLVQAVFLDNGYLTDLRTAAAGGVATRHLAPKNVKVAGVLGTGVQARLQIAAAYQERKFEKVLVWGRNKEHAAKCAEDIEKLIGVKAVIVPDVHTLVQQSQLVVTTTPSREPIIKADWVHANLHITAMGSDQEDKAELDPRIASSADLFVCDRTSQCEKLGELRSAIAGGNWNFDRKPCELGDVVVRNVTGRQNDTQLTVCDLTGTGVQDTAIANHAFSLAHSNGVGTRIHADSQ